MGSRGPAPKPQALKKLQGNPGRRKLNAAEPTPDSALPACPAWLNAEAKREWKRVSATLHVAGLLTLRVQRGAFARRLGGIVERVGHLRLRPRGRS